MSIGERIKSARMMAGQSQRKLADLADISPMAISKYERDLDTPGSSVLLRLAKALNVKIEYFFRSTTITLSEPAYRSKASLSTNEGSSIIEQVQEWLERYIDVEALLEMTPTLQSPAKLHVESLEEIEDAAIRLRDAWQLGLDPIERLIEVCEDKGIKIGLIKGYENFDALTLWANNTIPVIALQCDMPGDRQRFCIAHELGHLLLDVAPHIDEEKAAHRFAGAFLVPRPSAELELGPKRHTLGLAELQLLKQKYGVSMHTWIYRAKDLAILSEADATTLSRRFNQQKWQREEPGKVLPSEKPQRFKRLVLHAMCEGIISVARAAELVNESLLVLLGGEVEGYEQGSRLPQEECDKRFQAWREE